MRNTNEIFILDLAIPCVSSVPIIPTILLTAVKHEFLVYFKETRLLQLISESFEIQSEFGKLSEFK